MNNWNELPDNVVLSDNLNLLKRNYDFFLRIRILNMKKKKKKDNVKCRQLHIKSQV